MKVIGISRRLNHQYNKVATPFRRRLSKGIHSHRKTFRPAFEQTKGEKWMKVVSIPETPNLRYTKGENQIRM
jgi:hypothetical protein